MQPTSGSEISVIKINGNSFVSGLVWEPLKQRAYMKEAREIGKREKMDIVAIRLGFMAQAGFVKKDKGVTKGMYSLASALAGQIQSDAWIGAFELPTGQFALVAVFSGMIVSGCDFVGDRQEVLNHLKEMDSQPKVMEFLKVFHPADFGYRGSPLDIEALLKPEVLRKDYVLKQLTFGLTRRELIQYGAAVAVLAGLAIGYEQWQAYLVREAAEKARQAELLHQKQLAELSARAGADQTVQALKHPWATLPGVVDFLNGCQAAIDSLPLALKGWTSESALCTPTSLEAVYGRTGKTTFNDFVEAARDRFPNPPVLMEGGDRAGVGDVVSLGAGGDDELLPFEKLQADFTSYLQQLDLKADIVAVEIPVPIQPPLPGGEAPPPAPVPDWKQFSFSLTSPYSPQYLFAGLPLKGVRLVEISVVRQGPQLTWSLKGEMYAH